jgi:hypothetical protein
MGNKLNTWINTALMVDHFTRQRVPKTFTSSLTHNGQKGINLILVQIRISRLPEPEI